ncbi:MAG: hypothetical protein BWY19_00811 [bacterium ADurb.Bin212]|nr:MAG: hypothetical protein BWY19_00811 [bacterium ADurb.Bin212]
MGERFFETENGIRVYSENSDTDFADIIYGTAIPGGDSGDQDAASLGSIYLRGPTSELYQKIALVGSQSDWELIPRANKKLKFHLASLAAYDKVLSVTYLDSGLRTERINTVTYSSALYPNTNLVKTIFWLDVGTMKQRIDKEEYVGAVLAPDSVRKTHAYSTSGIRYKRDGYTLALF